MSHWSTLSSWLGKVVRKLFPLVVVPSSNHHPSDDSYPCGGGGWILGIP